MSNTYTYLYICVYKKTIHKSAKLKMLILVASLLYFNVFLILFLYLEI